MEAGACFSLLLSKTLTPPEKYLLNSYANYLHKAKFGYSFIHSFKIPKFSSAEKKQLLNTIGYIPEEEIYICGLATPLFRSIEAILANFGGYAKIDIMKALKKHPELKGEYHRIRKRKYISDLLIYSSYTLINWEIVGMYFNNDDPKEIKEIYSFKNFKLRNPLKYEK